MKLNFEYTQEIATGISADAIHFNTNIVQVFYLAENGLMMAKSAETPLGEWSNREFSAVFKACGDTNISNFMTNNISRYSTYGSWLSENRHRFAVYQPMYSVGDYVENGEISYSIDTPIASLSLELNNPDQAFIAEDQLGFLSPGSKIVLNYKSGDSDSYPIGVFYTDKSRFSVLSETISTDARNTIGKKMSDQSIDEYNSVPIQNAKTALTYLMSLTKLVNENNKPAQFKIADTTEQRGFTFSWDWSILQAVQEIIKTLQVWKISELADGTVIIGPSNYVEHVQPGRYTFHRDTDIWSREITRDDADAYTRVCVHNADKSFRFFHHVQQSEVWGIGDRKTLYVQCAEGTSSTDANNYAIDLANRLANCGVIESFAGPFRPQLMPGDEAEIIGTDDKSKLLGLITEVKHHFGKSGFWTEFTVDSGGSIRKGRLSDFIDKIGRKKIKGNSTRLYS